MKGDGEETTDPMPREPKEPILLTDDEVTAALPALIRVGLETLPAAIVIARCWVYQPTEMTRSPGF